MSLIRSLCRALPAGCTAWLETSTNVQWRARVKIAPANHSHEYVHCGISQRQHSQWLRHPGSSDGWIINFNVTMFLKQRKTLSLTGAFAGLSGCQRRLGCAITFFWNDTCQMMGTTLHDSHSTLCSHQILVRVGVTILSRGVLHVGPRRPFATSTEFEKQLMPEEPSDVVHGKTSN